MQDYLRKNIFNIDLFSVNKFIFGNDTDQTYFLTNEISDRGHKSFVQYISKLPKEFPFSWQIAFLLFAPFG